MQAETAAREEVEALERERIEKEQERERRREEEKLRRQMELRTAQDAGPESLGAEAMDEAMTSYQ